MNDIRLVNVMPIVNGWNDAAKKNLEEAKALMASGNHLDYNAGVVKESVANLVSGFADDLLKAPAVDPETLRPAAQWRPSVGEWIHVDDSGEVWSEPTVECSECGCAIPEGDHDRYVWNYFPVCGAKMEENNA